MMIIIIIIVIICLLKSLSSSIQHNADVKKLRHIQHNNNVSYNVFAVFRPPICPIREEAYWYFPKSLPSYLFSVTRATDKRAGTQPANMTKARCASLPSHLPSICIMSAAPRHASSLRRWCCFTWGTPAGAPRRSHEWRRPLPRATGEPQPPAAALSAWRALQLGEDAGWGTAVHDAPTAGASVLDHAAFLWKSACFRRLVGTARQHCGRDSCVLAMAHDLLLSSLHQGYDVLGVRSAAAPQPVASPFSGSIAACEEIVTWVCAAQFPPSNLLLRPLQHQQAEDTALVRHLVRPSAGQGTTAYFCSSRRTPLTLSLASSLLALPLPGECLGAVLRRTVHDNVFAFAPGSAPSQLAATAAQLFSTVTNALLNNDLFFSPDSADFDTLHSLLLSDVFRAAPLWASRAAAAERYYAAYRFGADGAAESGTLELVVESAKHNSVAVEIFSRRVRWVPLLNKLSRVYTKAGRGWELLAAQRLLLAAVPQAEVRWPCSFYVRVMGAVLDACKAQPCSDGWGTIREVAGQALSLYGESHRDRRSVWVILCKAALTLEPLRCSCERLLEAYSTLGCSTSSKAYSGVPIDRAALQQLMRLVRGAVTDAPHRIPHILDLLNGFIRCYSPRGVGDGSEWWGEWWLEVGGALLNDLLVACGTEARDMAITFTDTVLSSALRAGRESGRVMLLARKDWREPLQRFGLADADTESKPDAVPAASQPNRSAPVGWCNSCEELSPVDEVSLPADDRPPAACQHGSVSSDQARISGNQRPRMPMHFCNVGWRWRCGCGQLNPSSDLSCASCLHYPDAPPPAYTCPHCGSRTTSICCGVGPADTSVHDTPSMPLRMCASCSWPHPRDQTLLRHPVPPSATAPTNCRHCLLCGTSITLPMMWHLSNDASAPILFFHCGVLQGLDEKTLFCCECDKSVWQVGYHCRRCLLPRPELQQGSHEYYLWQCVRETVGSLLSKSVSDTAETPASCAPTADHCGHVESVRPESPGAVVGPYWPSGVVVRSNLQACAFCLVQTFITEGAGHAFPVGRTIYPPPAHWKRDNPTHTTLDCCPSLQILMKNSSIENIMITTTVTEIAHDTSLGLTLLVETPINSKNFVVFNKTCDQLNPSYLSQPINEAEYDSETQACVDLFCSDTPDAAGPSDLSCATDASVTRSFYDHYVRQPTKKKNMMGVGLEEPIRSSDVMPAFPGPSPSGPRISHAAMPRSSNPDALQGPRCAEESQMDFLTVPTERGLPFRPCTDGGHALLDNPVIRRMATGAVPPPCS
eukprot:gene8555-6001_t